MTYYVNGTTGCDSNPGTSPERPFKTLAAVNTLTLNPGDRVLLARGSVFENQYLQLCAQGSKEFPVTVEAYVRGRFPTSRPPVRACGIRTTARPWTIPTMSGMAMSALPFFYTTANTSASGIWKSPMTQDSCWESGITRRTK